LTSVPLTTAGDRPLTSATATPIKALAETGALQGTIRVPDAVGPITVDADLRAQAQH
jgi:hypothetical protein